jgi:hypothetical protein
MKEKDASDANPLRKRIIFLVEIKKSVQLKFLVEYK